MNASCYNDGRKPSESRNARRDCSGDSEQDKASAVCQKRITRRWIRFYRHEDEIESNVGVIPPAERWNERRARDQSSQKWSRVACRSGAQCVGNRDRVSRYSIVMVMGFLDLCRGMPLTITQAARVIDERCQARTSFVTTGSGITRHCYQNLLLSTLVVVP